MNKRLTILTSALICGTLAFAQKTPLVKYDIPTATYEHVFLDHVQDFGSMLINVQGGQYVGQVDDVNSIYGYGQFINDEGSVVIGKFRKGVLIQGISLGKDNVTVGDKDFYCSYSLTTGRLEYIYSHGEIYKPDASTLPDYTFMTMKYANGDSYVGELYQGKRHGIGIYYYANGGLWYGSYAKDLRRGFGVWIKSSNDLVIGEWDGEDVRRSIYIPLR